MRFSWYYKWHTLPISKPIHYLVLVIYTLGLPFMFYNFPQKPQQAKATTYDFPRWEWVNPKPTGNQLNKVITCPDSSVWAFGNSGIIFKSTDSGNTWGQQYTGVSTTLNDAVCLSNNNIIAVGYSGIILQYNGISWTQRISGTSNILNGVTVLDASHIAVAGNGAVTSISSDGGETWTIKSNGTIHDFQDITAINASTVAAIGFSSDDIVISTDAGQTWTTKDGGTSAGLYRMARLDDNNAIAVGFSGTITVSTDAGQTWEAKTSGTSNGFNEITVIDSTHVIAIGGSGTITVSTDAGQTWATKTSGTSSTLFAAAAVNTSNIIVVGDVGTITVSSDGGQTWATKTSGTSNRLRGVANLNTTDGIAVGNSGTITVSTDAGQTWAMKTSGTSNNNFPGVAKIGSTHAVAVGSNGTITVSSDGGQTWATKTSGTSNHLADVAALDSTHAVAVGNTGTITVSSDGGETWATKTSGTSNTLTNIIALDTFNVITVGVSGTITASTDAGQTWATKTSGTSSLLWSINALDSTNIVAVGVSGTITTSTDAGQTWATKTSGTSNTLTDVISLDSTLAIAVGGSGTITTSTDAGQTWTTKTSGTSNYLADVAALDSTHAVAVGNTGTITVSSDGGETWATKVSGTGNDLSKLSILDINHILAVGSTGTILRYHSPANATATKFLVKLPGQSFADGVGVYGTPTSVRAGETVTATIYAVDANNVLDKGNASTAGFATTDPNDSNPAPVQLTQGGTCVQTDRQPGDPECGIGTASFTFHTPGNWTITASDTGGVLSSGTSSSITVTPGVESSLYFTSSPPSMTAGSSSPALSLGLKDMYGNVVSAADSSHTISLSSSSSNGRFSSSSLGPWTSTLDVGITSGGTSASFYYLDYAAESSTITAASSGLASSTLSATTTSGAINALNSTCQVSSTSETADNSSVDVTATLLDNLSNKVSGKEVRLSSTRSEDSISQPTSTTNSSGIASGSIKSTKAGDTTITCKDETDGIFISSTPKLTFTPGPVSQLFLSGLSSLVEAGTSQQGTVTLKDRYNNLAANARGKLEFSSSDSRADLPSSYAYTNGDNGSHTFPFVFKGAGDKKLTVAYPSTGASTNYVFSVTPASVSSTHSTISSDKERIKDNGEDKAAITVTLKDSYDNGVKGKEVELKSSRREDSLRTINNISSTKGEAAFSLTSTKEGEAILTAVDMTDKLVLLDGLSLKIYKSPPIDSLSPAIKKAVETIKKVAQPIGEAAAAVGLLIFAAQGASYLLVLISGSARGKRARPWGIVFDALTGQPVDLAVVRLFEAQTKQLIQTKVTDMEGRFGFSVTPGTYVLSVTKGGYLFPITKGTLSRLVRGEGCYVGSPITIEDKVANLSLSIPLEPEQSTLHLKAKIRLIMRNALETITVTASHIFLPLIIIGLMMALGTAYLVQDTRSYLSAILYVVLLTIFLVRRAKRLHQLGRVIDTHNHPLEGVAIFLYDQEYQNLKATTQSDRHGRFTLFVPQGRYYLALTKEGYLFPPPHQLPSTIKGNIYKGGILELKGPGYVSPMVVMEGEG